MEDEVTRQYVGIDLHRRRSVIVRMNDEGQVLGIDQVLNDPVALSPAVAKAGPAPRWHWPGLMGGTGQQLLQADGAHVHLVHPLGLHWAVPSVTAPTTWPAASWSFMGCTRCWPEIATKAVPPTSPPRRTAPRWSFSGCRCRLTNWPLASPSGCPGCQCCRHLSSSPPKRSSCPS